MKQPSRPQNAKSGPNIFHNAYFLLGGGAGVHTRKRYRRKNLGFGFLLALQRVTKEKEQISIATVDCDATRRGCAPEGHRL